MGSMAGWGWDEGNRAGAWQVSLGKTRRDRVNCAEGVTLHHFGRLCVIGVVSVSGTRND